MTTFKLSEIEDGHLNLKVNPGIELKTAITAGIFYARELDCEIKFNFNGIDFVINKYTTYDSCIDAWDNRRDNTESFEQKKEENEMMNIDDINDLAEMVEELNDKMIELVDYCNIKKLKIKQTITPPSGNNINVYCPVSVVIETVIGERQ